MIFGEEARDWLRRALGPNARLLDIEPMKGSSSCLLYLISYCRDSQSQRCVLRVLNNEKWLTEEPDLVAHEAAALQEAQRAGLRAPSLLAYSQSDIGFGAPVVLMSYIKGTVEIRPSDPQQWLKALAVQLAEIHRHPADGFLWRFSSWVNRTTLAVPPWTSVPQVWERAIELFLQAPPDSPSVFLHRDYHPANLLWQQGRVSGVVDWINACRGPAGADVAHCRTNLALMFGKEAAGQYLEYYRDVAYDFIYEPYWDIDSILDMCLPEPEFYRPWQEFGLDVILDRVLQQRLDDYLQETMKSLEHSDQ